MKKLSGPAMTQDKSTLRWFAELSLIEKTAIAGSVVAATFLLLDPLVYKAVQSIDPAVIDFFRGITDTGKSAWILFISGGAIVLLVALRTSDLGPRSRAAHGLLAQGFGFLFIAIAASGIIANLAKNILGRARPKHFETFGSFHFEPFAFSSSFASFPSGHATTICAFAAVIAIIWPRTRVVVFVIAAWLAATRFFVSAHYFSDALAGMMLGFTFPYWLRERLATRRWLFARRADGTIRMRGRHLGRWIGKEAKSKLVTDEDRPDPNDDYVFPGHLSS